MQRRTFVQLAAAAVAAGVAGACASRAGIGVTASSAPAPADIAAWTSARRFANLPFGKIAYVERGSGRAALFLHGFPLNGFHWRGAFERLSAHRRCLAPDFMGLGYSEIPAGQSLAPGAQADMLAALLDQMAIPAVDLVANDSGGAVAQLFLVRYPERVRTLLLTNCDVEAESPPKAISKNIEQAQRGAFVDEWIVPQLTDKAGARGHGLGAGAYMDPAHLTDELIDFYFTPLASSPAHKARADAFVAALVPNALAGITPQLRRCTVPTRIVWGTRDTVFSPAYADYLDRTFPKSRGVRRIPDAKLFFPEELPDAIAEEARMLWGI